ncbi:prepilin-type N-terminal cleavage/methylation domain-containing protein [Candidatus Dojkabacteria bacterium]|nr:prepilin-type N-terminal cleavage/methylation domain-containing protein [Candidatus Dojkabacteria bacterium]
MNKINLKTNKRKGFTLIESILYIAMSSVILGMALLMLYSLIQYRAKDKIRRDVDSEVLRVLEYLSQNIRNSQTLEIRDTNNAVVTSGFGQKLFIDTLNINNTYTNILVYLDSGAIKVDKNSVTSNLSSNLVRISNLQFRYLTGTAGSSSGAEIVDIQFVAEYALASSSAYEYQRDIAVSVKLR